MCVCVRCRQNISVNFSACLSSGWNVSVRANCTAQRLTDRTEESSLLLLLLLLPSFDFRTVCDLVIFISTFPTRFRCEVLRHGACSRFARLPVALESKKNKKERQGRYHKVLLSWILISLHSQALVHLLLHNNGKGSIWNVVREKKKKTFTVTLQDKQKRAWVDVFLLTCVYVFSVFLLRQTWGGFAFGLYLKAYRYFHNKKQRFENELFWDKCLLSYFIAVRILLSKCLKYIILNSNPQPILTWEQI